MEKQKAGNIAYCIPTYNHPETIRDILLRCAKLYQKYDIDIYIYDSSTDNKTRAIVQEYIYNGCDNIYYIKTDHILYEKIEDMYAHVGWRKNYKYFWPVKDRNCFSEETIKAVIDQISLNRDLLFLPMIFGEEDKIKKVYEDPIEFYGDWGWLCTSMDVLIFNVDSMVDSLDRKKIWSTYLGTVMKSFNLYVYAFHPLPYMKMCKIGVVDPCKIKTYESPYSTTSWYNNRFYIMKNWVLTNHSLPVNYDKYISITIKKFGSLPFLLGSIESLLDLRRNNVLNHKTYLEIKPVWDELVDISVEKLWLIANDKTSDLCVMILNEIESLINRNHIKQAFYIFEKNKWLYEVEQQRKIVALLHIYFSIYSRESELKIKNNIFADMCDYDQMFTKLLTVKRVIRRIEFFSTENDLQDLRNCINFYRISMPFLAFIIKRTCTDSQKVLKIIGDKVLI